MMPGAGGCVLMKFLFLRFHSRMEPERQAGLFHRLGSAPDAPRVAPNLVLDAMQEGHS
jgi:hypothetical protein